MLTLKSPAKINWSLFVLDKREDGYHNILSLMHCIGLYDTLTFDDADALELVDGMDIPKEQNLVFRAASALREHTGVTKGAKITLEKEIPSGAGLGGGSSNAAYTLMGLNKLWGLGLDRGELSSIGGRLGSDVPFFFRCPLAVAEGKGEVLTPLEIGVPHTVLLVKPAVSISTKWAYGAIHSHRKAGKELTKTGNKINNIQLIYEALRTGSVSGLNPVIHNDFEEVVQREHPVIGSIKAELLGCGAAGAVMSGSGSVVFGLFENKEQAWEASWHFPHHFSKVVETLTTVTSNE